VADRRLARQARHHAGIGGAGVPLRLGLSEVEFGRLCLPDGYDKRALGELHCLIEHVGPFHAGDEIFRTGDAFSAIFSVRAGLVKAAVEQLDLGTHRMIRHGTT